jgi:hypothetical protein
VIDAGVDIHAHALAGDNATALRGIDREGALDGNTLIRKAAVSLRSRSSCAGQQT